MHVITPPWIDPGQTEPGIFLKLLAPGMKLDMWLAIGFEPHELARDSARTLRDNLISGTPQTRRP